MAAVPDGASDGEADGEEDDESDDEEDEEFYDTARSRSSLAETDEERGVGDEFVFDV